MPAQLVRPFAIVVITALLAATCTRAAGPEDELSSPDPRRRIAAAQALAASGEAAEHVPELWSALRGELSDQRGIEEADAYMSALIRAGVDVEARLLAAVEDRDHILAPRVAAAWARVDPGTAAAGAARLAERLDHPDRDVRLRAAEALGAMGEVAAPAVDDLIAALGSDDSLLRDRAAGALGSIGPLAAKAVPALAALLAEKDFHVRSAAIGALEWIGPAAKEAVPALEDLRAEIERSGETPALEARIDLALRRIGPASARSFEALWDDFAGGDMSRRSQAMNELRTLTPDESRLAFARLTEFLAKGDLDAQRLAAQILGTVGPDGTPAPSPEAEAAVAALVRALGSDDADLRAWAATSLGNFGELALPYVDRWIAVLGDPDETVASLAGHGLAELGPAAVPALLAYLADSARRGRAHAVEALTAIRMFHPDAVGTADLRHLLRDPDPEVRRQAAELLAGDLGADPAAAALGARQLIEQLRSEEALEAFTGFLRLTEMGPSAVEHVVPLLDDPSPRIRLRALSCLGLMEPAPESAAPRIRRLVREDPEPAVRRHAELVLRAFLDEDAKADLFEGMREGGFATTAPEVPDR